MALIQQGSVFNPITGVFGTGQVQFYPGGTTAQTYTWTVPPGIGKVRVRVWGGGAGGNGATNGGGGGGFAMKAIYDLTGVASITVTVGLGGASTISGGTSSFGSFVSVTGGVSSTGAGGTATGGDLNYTGGAGAVTSIAGGGVAGLFGNGGNANASAAIVNGANGCSGSGGGASPSCGGNGFLGVGAQYSSTATTISNPATSGLQPQFSIDFIGCGGGGTGPNPGVNGGGGGSASFGGYPGGGGGSSAYGAPGLVIVEW
jgi:hypothetical protein